MAAILFAEVLKSSLDIPSINRYFVENRDKTLAVLQALRPEGRVEGSRFKLASEGGGAGGSWDFNLENGKFGDWAGGNQSYGVVDFVCRTTRCSAAQAVKYLVDKKHLDKREAKRALNGSEGDPLVLPIPQEMQSWETVLQSDELRRDKGIIRAHWEYRDLDGSLLGYKYRVDERSTGKEIYTLTYRAESGWTKKAWQKKLVPPYGLETLRDGPTIRVLFVEGEKAADEARKILGQRWKVLSFSGVSAADDLWIPDEPFWEDCEVVIWPDNDVPGREAARKLQISLQKLTTQPKEIRMVRVESIPGLPPKWDIGDWHADCGVDVMVEMERAERLDSFERVCREWVYVTQQNQFHNLEDRAIIWSTVSFDNRYRRYADKSGSASQKFLAALDTTKVDDLEFIPGEGAFVTTGTGKVFLNEWFPSPAWSQAKAIAADPSVSDEEIAQKARCFVAHLDRICSDNEVECDKDPEGNPIPGTENRSLTDALATYFSRLVSRPMDKQGWVPMLLSEHNGTGKTYFVEMVASILGGNRCTSITVRQYIGQYHDWRDGILFYELGEAKHEENTEAYEELKKNHNHRPFDFGKIPDRSLGAQKLNIKSRGMKTQRDFLNGYVTSNNLYPLALSNSTAQDASDRRLLVIRCETILTQSQADELFAEIHERPEWIGAWLMRYRTRDPWNPGWAPVTAHKRKIMERDRQRAENRVDKYELGKFDDFFYLVQWAKDEGIGGFARKVITGDCIREIAENRRVKFPYESEKFDRILDRAGVRVGPHIKIDGQLRKVYSTTDEMQGRPDSEWRAEHERTLKSLQV